MNASLTGTWAGEAAVRPASARFAVQRVTAVPRAELLHLEPVGVVAPVLLGDVVAVLALHAGQRDLRTHIRALARHGTAFSRKLVRRWGTRVNRAHATYQGKGSSTPASNSCS